MESTLHSLATLLVQAIPTIIFFLFLTVFLNATLFKPLGRVLEERRRSTEGTRALAEQAFAAADKRASEFEHALQLARGEIYAENEARRRQWAEEQAKELERARAEAERSVNEARQAIGQEMSAAQAELDSQVHALSERIIDTLLHRRAA